MRRMRDTTCPRCGATTSTEGLDAAAVRAIAAAHVCADGVRQPSGEPTERVVPGPGERTQEPPADEEVRTYWLSFAEHGFRGVAIVRVPASIAAAAVPLLPPTARPGAEWVAAATQIAYAMACNPGGQVLAYQLAVVPGPEWIGRLLTAAEAAHLRGLLSEH